MRRITARRGAGFALALLVSSMASVPAADAADLTLASWPEWLSDDSHGHKAARQSWDPQVSVDGRMVLFTAEGNFLGNGMPVRYSRHPWVRDRATGSFERVDVDPEGAPDPTASLSPDGRFAAYKADQDPSTAVYVRDLQADTSVLVSEGIGGGPAFGESFGGQVSAGGRYVVFESNSADLVHGVDPVPANPLVFVRDMLTGTTELVSRGRDGALPDAAVDVVAISPDARFMIWDSRARNLTVGEHDGAFDVFLHDRVTGTTTKVSQIPGGKPSRKLSLSNDLADDGSSVVFESEASNLAAGDTNHAVDVFMFTAATGSVTLLSRGLDGESARKGAAGASLSSDGRYVAYHAEEPYEQVEGVGRCKANIVLRDLVEGTAIVAVRERDGSPSEHPVGNTTELSDTGFLVYSTVDSLDPDDLGWVDTYGTQTRP
jgi:Tol biopolymer transport system component